MCICIYDNEDELVMVCMTGKLIYVYTRSGETHALWVQGRY